MRTIRIAKPMLPSLMEFFFYATKIWKSRMVSNNGQFHMQLEKDLLHFLEAENVVIYSNGHLALEAAIEAMELSGDVITTPFTFSSTTQAILRKGLKPVFCDISADNYTIDVDKIESLITDKTSAILPVHVYGNVCDVERIQQIADRHNLKVIYDAAHSFGVKFNNVSVCQFGDASMLSFHATKVFNTLEGGAVVFREGILRQKLNALKNFGIDSDGFISSSGGNAKMNELQALIGLLNLKKINVEIKNRRLVYEQYQDGFINYNGISLVSEQINVKSNYSYYSILITNEEKSSEELVIFLNSKRIVAKRYFFPLTSEIGQLQENINANQTPIAKYVSDRVVALPIYGDLKRKEVQRVINSVKEYMEL